MMEKNKLRQIRKRCPACKREFTGTLVICPTDDKLLIPIREEMLEEMRWVLDFPCRKICRRCQGCFEAGDVCPTDGTELVALVWTDKPIVDKKWTIIGVIGDGRLTRVFEISGPNNERAVIKVLQAHLSGDRKTATRFITALKDAASLDHINIGKIIDGGLLGMRPYVTMEFIDGCNLQSHLGVNGARPVSEAVPIFVGICHGLSYAHKAGVMHNNLTMSNVYLTTQGTVKIVDFGLAERLFRGLEWDQQMTHTASLYGNGLCLSPEYCKKGVTSERCDIYSVGCIMYETLSGHPVFEKDNGLMTLYAHMTEKAPPFNPQLKIPDWLAKVVLKCLEKDPDKRFQNADELSCELSKGLGTKA